MAKIEITPPISKSGRAPWSSMASAKDRNYVVTVQYAGTTYVEGVVAHTEDYAVSRALSELGLSGKSVRVSVRVES